MNQLDLFAGDPLICSCGQPARPQTCPACRTGAHGDHHDGIWDRASHDDPVFCPCEHCGGIEAARTFTTRMAEIRANRTRPCGA